MTFKVADLNFLPFFINNKIILGKVAFFVLMKIKLENIKKNVFNKQKHYQIIDKHDCNPI